MKPSVLLVLFLFGCSQATARSKAPAVSDSDGLLVGDQWAELTYDGAQGTQRSLAVLQSRLDALPADQHAKVVAAAQGIVVTCAYNRAAVQLPVVLHQVAKRHDPSRVSPRGRLEWARVQQGLAQHVALLASLEVAGLPMPKSTDHLGTFDSHLQSGAQLARSADPIADSQPILDVISEVVDSFDNDNFEDLDAWRLILNEATGDNWPLGQQLGAWQNHLSGLQGRVDDPALEADLEKMVNLIKAWGSQGC